MLCRISSWYSEYISFGPNLVFCPCTLSKPDTCCDHHLIRVHNQWVVDVMRGLSEETPPMQFIILMQHVEVWLLHQIRLNDDTNWLYGHLSHSVFCEWAQRYWAGGQGAAAVRLVHVWEWRGSMAGSGAVLIWPCNRFLIPLVLLLQSVAIFILYVFFFFFFL